jgi:hypothetical protein
MLLFAGYSLGVRAGLPAISACSIITSQARALRFQRHTTIYSRTSKAGRAQANEVRGNFPRKKRTAVSDFASETKRTIYLEAYANNCFRQRQH